MTNLLTDRVVGLVRSCLSSAGFSRQTVDALAQALGAIVQQLKRVKISGCIQDIDGYPVGFTMAVLFTFSMLAPF